MARFINPFTDVGFKRIFGQAIHKELLIDFLNDLLVGEKRITDITFLDKDLLPDFSGDRGVIYDIYCTNEDGEQFIVEMQNREQTFFRERALYYLSRAIARQGERGAEWKFNLKAVYGIFFMNFHLSHSPGKFRTDIVLSDGIRTKCSPTSSVSFSCSSPASPRKKMNAKLILNVGFMY